MPYQLYPTGPTTALHITLVPANWHSTLLLDSLHILSLPRLVLNNVVKNSTALSPKHLYTSTGMPFGLPLLVLFILFIASLT